MAKQTVITIGPHDRNWAHPPAERSWQRFWGQFELQVATGLYVERGSDPTHLKNLASAFQKLPKQLQKLAIEWRVTFNLAPLFTASGDASTFYADFKKATKGAISPHIEMGRKSLQAAYILAHLTHELSHLYWRTRSETERQQYRQFLLETCRKGTVEVTEYVQDYFEQHLKVSQGGDKATFNWDKSSVLERWVEESFCDTMAALIDPDYPSYDSSSTAHLPTRSVVISSTFALTLPKTATGSKARAKSQRQ